MPIYVQSEGIQTSFPLFSHTPKGLLQYAATGPTHIPVASQQSTITSAASSKISSIESSDRAPVRCRLQDPLPYLPPLPRTAQELLLVGQETTRSESEVDSLGTARGERVVFHPILGDLFLTGSGKHAQRNGNGQDYGGWGRTREGEKRNAYGTHCREGGGRPQKPDRIGANFPSKGSLGSSHAAPILPSGDSDRHAHYQHTKHESQNARGDSQTSSVMPVRTERG